LEVTVLEATDDIGGRLRTDVVQGFTLDRGFQVLQTEYPEAQRQLDYHSLDLHPLHPGALIRCSGRWFRFYDPIRAPQYALSSLLSGVGTWQDGIRLIGLRREVLRTRLEDLFKKPELPLFEALQKRGFSKRIIERFFQPFFTAVFFDPKLKTTSRMFEFVFRIFAAGSGALPRKGIMAVPRQLARSFPSGLVQCNSGVQRIEQGKVILDTGREIKTKAVVVACDGRTSANLLQKAHYPQYLEVSCIYFRAPEPPIREPVIILGKQGEGPVSSMCVPSQVASSYAPEGQSLISVTVVGQETINGDDLAQAVKAQAQEWFGNQAREWNHIESYRIHEALPAQHPPTADPFRRQIRIIPGIYLAGDLGSLSSLQWALLSGRKAAEAVIQDFGLTFQGSNMTEGVLDPRPLSSISNAGDR
jgi:phytoene dehydrogenase-like protein